MQKTEYTYYYFLGIGGIGMSALARYFAFKGASVFGYDKTSSALTVKLEEEGIAIHYTDSTDKIPTEVLENKEDTLIIYTPAIPQNHTEYVYLQQQGYTIVKRAEVLGLICNPMQGIGIAGTHGKTSTTTFTSHILFNSQIGCNAFLGGISKNFGSNYIFHPTSNICVVEADEYDRSFHKLHPHTALITSIDADHLDIYGSYENICESFAIYMQQIKENGNLIYKYGLQISKELPALHAKQIKTYTYAVDNAQADFYASKIERTKTHYTITLQTPFGVISEIAFYLPGKVNIENMIAASAVALCNGVTAEELISAIETLRGVERRLDLQLQNANVIYIDDYAHHPEELKACIGSIKELYYDKKITGIFQPHLYSRTQDFAKEFGESLSMLDEVILLDIYPARELPIAGVTSQIIFDNIHGNTKLLCTKENLLDTIAANKPEVLLTMGAGDIDRFVKPLTDLLQRITK